MSYFEYNEKLETIQRSIESKTFVTSYSLCLRLGVSRRTLMRMIDHLRLTGINIQFCRREKKYFVKK